MKSSHKDKIILKIRKSMAENKKDENSLTESQENVEQNNESF